MDNITPTPPDQPNQQPSVPPQPPFQPQPVPSMYQQGSGFGIPPMSVANYLVWAILVTIFCCLPFGIPAIVYATKVNGKLEAGDYAGAVQASKNAKMWIWISVAAGLLFLILNFVLGGFTAYIQSNSHS